MSTAKLALQLTENPANRVENALLTKQLQRRLIRPYFHCVFAYFAMQRGNPWPGGWAITRISGHGCLVNFVYYEQKLEPARNLSLALLVAG